ncbi:MAG: type II toxin-antitoxin system VapC family toxin [Burkholderiales bacterium]
MRLLLDTHVLLWALTRSDRLSAKGWNLLEDVRNPLTVSAVSIWDIAIKHARPRGTPGDMPISAQKALAEVRAANFDLLDISLDHAAALDSLPLHHRDPFDRLLVAQAMAEPMFLLTHDAKLDRYGEMVLVV